MSFIDWLQNLTGIEWVQVISAIVGGLAAVFALLAILQSARNSRKNEEALIRERRIDFELSILAELAELCAQSGSVVTRDTRLRTLAEMLDEETVPRLRAVFGLPSTQAGEAWKSELKQETLALMIDDARAELSKEVVAAVRAKLTERGI